jgi:ribonuclease P protein component
MPSEPLHPAAAPPAARLSPQRFRLRKAQRLAGPDRFDLIYKTGTRRSHFPLDARTLRRPDELPARLGISIGRRCGNAVQRNLIKRRLREAFRLAQHDIPPGRDYLVIVRPHKPLPMLDYQLRLRQICR